MIRENYGYCSRFACIYHNRQEGLCKFEKPYKKCIIRGQYEKCPHDIASTFCHSCKTVQCSNMPYYMNINNDNSELNEAVEKIEEVKELPLEFKEEVTSAIAYVDGSFNKYTKTYGYGGVLIVGDDIEEFSKAGNDADTATMYQIGGEILAACTAINMAKKRAIKNLTIYYDYEGIEKWATGQWKANKPKTQAYVNFIRKCGVNLSFSKIKAHTGVKYNEIADQLAKKASGVI